MNTQYLKKALGEFSLSKHEDYFKSLILPSVEIINVESNIKIACSKLGGIPDVSSDFEWPKHQSGDYRFVAQFNLGEISQPFSHLPEKGLLSIFIADHEDYFWNDDGYAKVYFFDTEKELKPCSNPNFPDQPCISVKLETSIDIPLRLDLFKVQPLNDERLVGQLDEEETEDFEIQLEELFDKIADNKQSNYLLGYPLFTSLGYDPRESEDWTSLLTLWSVSELNWCWHDGDFLMLFIEKEKLEHGDFSYIKSDAG